MNRYTRRRVSRSRQRPSSAGFRPVVAFLLIASFGILFAGCSNVQVKGPEAGDFESFTAEDAERLARLDGEDSEVPSQSGSTVSSAQASDSVESPVGGGIALTGSGAVTPVDPALRQRFDAIRTPSGAGNANTYRVINTFVNVRSEPNSGAATVTQLKEGESVTVQEFVNAQWAKVALAGGGTGYVSVRYIGRMATDTEIAAEDKAGNVTYFVNYAFVNVRASKDVSSEKLGQIPGQALLKPLAIEGDWAKVNFEGKEAYVSMQFLAPFRPNLIVRQESFTLPVLRYDISDAAVITTMVEHASALRAAGARFTTLKAFHDLLLSQQARDVRLQQKSVIISVTGITPENIRTLSDALYGAGIPATFFIETRHLGVSGISQRLISTLKANGFDLQSAGHTGDDLRGLTNAQVALELRQSRQLLEDMANQSVVAVYYPQGGVNDRVTTAAADAGYLFGVGSVPSGSFTRDQFLRLPSYGITSAMSVDDVKGFLE